MESQEDRKARVQRCVDKVNQVLNEENCFMEPVIVLIGDKKIISEVKVYAKTLPKQVPVTSGEVVEEKPSETEVVEQPIEGEEKVEE